MKLILQAIKSLFRNLENRIPKTAKDVGALPNTVKTLPNPNTLTFKGAASGSYDGSEPIEVLIPDGFPDYDAKRQLILLFRNLHIHNDMHHQDDALGEFAGKIGVKHGLLWENGFLYYYSAGRKSNTIEVFEYSAYYYYNNGKHCVVSEDVFIEERFTYGLIPEGYYHCNSYGHILYYNMYNITNNLTNVTTSNDLTKTGLDTFYTATLTPVDGYKITSVTVMYGTYDETLNVYKDGVITIYNVSDDLVITATAEPI